MQCLYDVQHVHEVTVSWQLGVGIQLHIADLHSFSKIRFSSNGQQGAPQNSVTGIDDVQTDGS